MNDTSSELPADPQASPENAGALVLDGKRYALDQLSEAARKTIASIKYCDELIQLRRNELAVADTARMAYSRALKNELENVQRDAETANGTEG